MKGYSLPKGDRPRVEKLGTISPNKYNIVSEFDPKKHHRRTSDTFGISREVSFS